MESSIFGYMNATSNFPIKMLAQQGAGLVPIAHPLVWRLLNLRISFTNIRITMIETFTGFLSSDSLSAVIPSL